MQSRRAAENPAEIADIFAQDDHVGIARKHDIERLVDRLDHVETALGVSGNRIAWLLHPGAHSSRLPGHLLLRSRLACASCSSRCQGHSSNTSSIMVWTGRSRKSDVGKDYVSTGACRWVR